MAELDSLIFFSSLLVLLAIFAGMLTSRFGAPLLLVFLGLGLLAGEDGPGGVPFDDFHTTYLVGSAALALILFDGGLRTRRETFELAAWPALTLATIGVLVTAGLVAVAGHYWAGLAPVEAFLVGAIVGSTDAAAVFFLLNVRGMEIQKRVAATLEVESGINDPMAVFLTVTCVEWLRYSGAEFGALELTLRFIWEMAGGGLIGVAGGFALVWVINRVDFASGLYPIVVAAAALALYGGAEVLHCSGFLTVYLAGLVLGNRRHRATQLIARFHDGLAWLSQIIMFLVLGLLVTPRLVMPDLPDALAIAAVLVLVARPVAVALCLAPFKFRRREILFVGWVGLRGAVPIFLATVPVVAGLPGAQFYFSVAFVVVVVSLALQGWTIARAAHLLDLELPPPTEAPERLELEQVTGIDRDIAGYRVSPGSLALGYPYAQLPLPRRTRVLAVIRQGTVMDRVTLPRLEADDYVLTVTPPQHMLTLDRLFASRFVPRDDGEEVFGEFVLGAEATLGTVADFYCFPVKPEERTLLLGDFFRKRLRRRPVVGDRLRLGDIELVVREMADGQIKSVGIELAPDSPLERFWLTRRLRAWFRARPARPAE